jgi:hypothetical protein
MPRLKLNHHINSTSLGGINLVMSQIQLVTYTSPDPDLPSINVPTILDTGASLCVIGCQAVMYFRKLRKIPTGSGPIQVQTSRGIVSWPSKSFTHFQNAAGDFGETEVLFWATRPTPQLIPITIPAKFLAQPTGFHNDNFILLGTQFLHQTFAKVAFDFTQTGLTSELEIR